MQSPLAGRRRRPLRSATAGLPPEVAEKLRAIRYREEVAAALADPASPAARFLANIRAQQRFIDAHPDRETGLDALKEENKRQFQAAERAHPRAPRALPCQSGNFSPLDHLDLAEAAAAALPAGRRTPLSSGYRRRRAFEVEQNISYALWQHGTEIARRAGGPDPDPAAARALGTRYALELTVTLPAGTDPLESPALFARAWDLFNRKFLMLQKWMKSWLMVKESHRSGTIHAHVLILTNYDTWKNGRPPKFYKNRKTGAVTVAGPTCAGWIGALWRLFRGQFHRPGARRKQHPAGQSPLINAGLGTRHTLQPIQNPEKFGKYLSKYLVKGFKEERPAHLKSVRLVNYAQNFPRCCRVFWFKGYPAEPDPAGADLSAADLSAAAKRRRIVYLTKPRRDPAGAIIRPARPAIRWEMQTAFSFAGPAGRHRRRALAAIGGKFGAADYADLTEIFGARFAWHTEPLCALWRPPECPPGTPGHEWEPGALAYHLAGIERYTALDPLYISETGYRAAQSELPSMEDEKRRTFTFCNLYRDRISGATVDQLRAEQICATYAAEFFRRADAQREKLRRGPDDTGGRTMRSELHPMPEARHL